jgi:hypothetical protein
MKKEVKPTPLDIIATRIKTRARDNIFDNGADLLKAQLQLDHGQFIEWLEEHWDKSIASAYNAMGAAELAAKFPIVRKLKLRATALYRLANTEDLDEAFREAVFAEAAKDWVTVDRLDEIENELYPPPPEEETAEEDEEETAEEETDEAAAILDGPPPEMPPDPPPQPSAGRAEEMFFDQTISRLITLSTKPIATFDEIAAKRRADLGTAASFLHELITRAHSRRGEGKKQCAN